MHLTYFICLQFYPLEHPSFVYYFRGDLIKRSRLKNGGTNTEINGKRFKRHGGVVLKACIVNKTHAKSINHGLFKSWNRRRFVYSNLMLCAGEVAHDGMSSRRHKGRSNLSWPYTLRYTSWIYLYSTVNTKEDLNYQNSHTYTNPQKSVL